MSSMWQRRYAGWVRDARRLGREPVTRRVTLLSRRLDKARYEFGELLFTLYVCRDSRLSKEESERHYLFRLRLLREQLDGSEHWRKQYERRAKNQSDAPPDQAREIEGLLWNGRGLFCHLLAEMEACQQVNEPIYSRACALRYQERLAALGTALQACTVCMYCGEHFPHGRPLHRPWCTSEDAQALGLDP